MLVVVAAVVALATTTWQVVPIAVLLEAALVVGVVINTYSVMRSATQAPQSIAEPTLRLGDEVAPDRAASALTELLRDAHSQARGAQRFLAGCVTRLASVPADDETRALKV